MVLIEHVFSDCYTNVKNGFRPLAGIMVLIVRYIFWESRFNRSRFRPLAGIMVLIVVCAKSGKAINAKSFRPLAGIMVLIGIIPLKRLQKQ